MTTAQHLARMAIGWLLFWCVARAMPVAWWYTPTGLFWWAVPHFGYYAYRPHDLAWWRATYPSDRTVCDCQSLGHPEQCDMQAGCRWLAKLEAFKEASELLRRLRDPAKRATVRE